MATTLNSEVVELLHRSGTIKILSTVDEHGVPHTVAKSTVGLDEDGNVIYLEGIESSRTNRNLVRSIWYDRKVSVTLLGDGGNSYQIKGTPIKSIVSGPLFQRHYEALRAQLGDVDLAAVWVIAPEEVINESWRVRQQEEEAKHPSFIHLDRLVKTGA